MIRFKRWCSQRKHMISLLQQFKNGLSRQEIADFHGVSLRTIYNWEKKTKKFFDETSLFRLICRGCNKGWFPEELDEKKSKEEKRVEYEDLREELESWDKKMERIRREVYGLDEDDQENGEWYEEELDDGIWDEW